MKVVVLGAGFGGLELTTRLREELGHAADVVLVDRTDNFVFGYSKLDVMFGRLRQDEVIHPYADLVEPGVRFVKAEVEEIDPGERLVTTSAGTFDADVLVVALGADLDPAATPGLLEGGHEFYTEEGAFATREVLEHFAGGHVVVGVTSAPFKCPPAPSETALLMHEYLSERGLRDSSTITLTMPLPSPVPPSPDASRVLLDEFGRAGVEFIPEVLINRVDAERHVVVLSDGRELPYDLFLGIPVHRAPAVVERAGLTVDGWIPVDPLTLQTAWPGVYAVGDVTSVGTPKAGIFAEGQAATVADRIIAQDRAEGSPTEYDGHGVCYFELGGGNVATVDVRFVSGQPPTGSLNGPSRELAAVKAEFGSSRVRRWFGRTWP